MVYYFGNDSSWVFNHVKSGIEVTVIDIDGLTNVKSDDVVLTDKIEYKKIKQKLSSRTINVDTFRNAIFDNPLDGNYEDYDHLLMGMSHSQCGILDEFCVKHGYYKMSRPSLDIFLQLEFIKKHSVGYYNKDLLKKIVIELPYYIFNYDLSSQREYVFSRLGYFDLVGSFHNLDYDFIKDGGIESFRIYKSLFENPKTPEGIPETNMIMLLAKTIVRGGRVLRLNENVWKKRYNDTIEENKSLFDGLINYISSNYRNAAIKVLVMPFNPLFRTSYRGAINEWRDMFYGILSRYDLEIHDDFDLFHNPMFFSDHCHLNSVGRNKYCSFLEERKV